MFDIGFSELLLVGVIALVVLGPDKLPGALRTLGLWIGRLRRSFNSIKAEIEREVGADEVRRQLRNEAIMEKIKSTRSQVTESLDSVKQQAEGVKKDLDLSKELDEFKSLTGQDEPGGAREKDKTAPAAKPEIKAIAGDEAAATSDSKAAPTQEPAASSAEQKASPEQADQADQKAPSASPPAESSPKPDPSSAASTPETAPGRHDKPEQK